MKSDEQFLRLVKEIAKSSNDPTTKVGAIIIANNMLITACNHLIGLEKKERFNRPEKYKYFEHAERNVIYKAAKDGIKLDGGIMYTNSMPCMECARAIIQSGIKNLVCYDGYSERWEESQHQAEKLLEECNIQIRKYQNK